MKVCTILLTANGWVFRLVISTAEWSVRSPSPVLALNDQSHCVIPPSYWACQYVFLGARTLSPMLLVLLTHARCVDISSTVNRHCHSSGQAASNLPVTQLYESRTRCKAQRGPAAMAVRRTADRSAEELIGKPICSDKVVYFSSSSQPKGGAERNTSAQTEANGHLLNQLKRTTLPRENGKAQSAAQRRSQLLELDGMQRHETITLGMCHSVSMTDFLFQTGPTTLL